jgi:hypothetical protein
LHRNLKDRIPLGGRDERRSRDGRRDEGDREMEKGMKGRGRSGEGWERHREEKPQ